MMTAIWVELLIVLVLFGVVTALRHLNRRHRLPVGAYLVTFLLILWGGLFVGVSLPSLSGETNREVFQIIGGVLVGVAVVMLSAVWRMDDVTTYDPLFPRYFGEELTKEFGEGDLRISAHTELNARAFNRFARVLRAFGHVVTESIEQKIMISNVQKSGFYLYDYDVTLRYSMNSQRVELPAIIPVNIEVQPYREVRIASERFPLRWGHPLQYNRPEDKWPGKFYVPLLDDGDPLRWDMVVDQWNSVAQGIEMPICTVSDLDSVGELEHIPVTGPEFRESVEHRGVGESSTRNVSFSAGIKLGRRRRVALRYALRNLPHPADYFWMAWYAGDLVTNRWTLSINSEFPILRDALCVSTYEDLVVEVEGKGTRYLRITIEPRGKRSIIMPYDCVLVSLDPRSIPELGAPCLA